MNRQTATMAICGILSGIPIGLIGILASDGLLSSVTTTAMISFVAFVLISTHSIYKAVIQHSLTAISAIAIISTYQITSSSLTIGTMFVAVTCIVFSWGLITDYVIKKA